MDEKLTSAIEDFITTRINDHGSDASDEVTDTVTKVVNLMEKFAKTLTPEQHYLWRELENALSLQTGEENRDYYKSGLYDALRLLERWDG